MTETQNAVVAEPDQIGLSVAGHVSGKAGVVLKAPAVVVTHVSEDERGRGEGAVAVAGRGINSRVAEPDDIGAVIAVEVTHDPQVLGPVPALRLVESGEHQFRRRKRAVSVAQGDPNSVRPDSNQVRPAVAGHIQHEARVLIDAPALVISQVHDHESRRLEGAVAIAQGRPHAGIAESDQVGLAVSGDVGHEARMLIDAPALVISQVRDDELDGLEGAIPVVPRRPDAGIAETDNVRAAVPGQVREETGMPFDHPARVEVEAAQHHVRRLERAVAVVEGGPNAVKSEANDVRPAIPGKVRDEAGLLGTPALTTPAHLRVLPGLAIRLATSKAPIRVDCLQSVRRRFGVR